MVQLSPDTYTKGWDWCSGYHDTDKSLMGFSHTHLSGTGIGDLLDVLLMPGTGEPKIDPGPRENPESGYRSRFSHADEVATPGYYSVLLRD
jgi:putative alpha-1,2-mannosidase